MSVHFPLRYLSSVNNSTRGILIMNSYIWFLLYRTNLFIYLFIFFFLSQEPEETYLEKADRLHSLMCAVTDKVGVRIRIWTHPVIRRLF